MASVVRSLFPIVTEESGKRFIKAHGRVALVCMPWGSISKPSLAMGILKRCVEEAGFDVDMHYLNLHFAKRVGLRQYETVVQRSMFQTEWFFSQALFGRATKGGIANSWEDLGSDSGGRRLRDELVRILDGSAEECLRIARQVNPFIRGCVDNVDWSRYAVVGFTTTFAQSLSSLLLAKCIKERNPNVQIVMGGANVDSEMGVEFLNGFSWVDYIVHGEAEKSFPALLSQIEAGRLDDKLPGVSMRKGGQVQPGDSDAVPIVNLNESPIPDYSDYLQELEKTGLRRQVHLTLYFESSRGCWWGAKHHCTFCGLNGATMAYRKKDSTRVRKEILELASAYRCLNLAATDNIIANEYFTELLPQLGTLDLSLFYEVKANLSWSRLKALHDAGVNRIQPGIESFNSRLLHLMRKGVSAIQNLQLLKWCEELGISPGYNLLFGFPGETAADYQNLPGLFRLLTHLCPPGSAIPLEYERFSPYFFDAEKFGLQLKARTEYEFIFPPDRVEMDKIAYFFERVDQEPGGPLPPYMEPVLEAFNEWTRLREAGKTSFYYQKGPGYLLLHDSRPRANHAPAETRRIYLNEPYSSIYLFCDENRSFRAIHESLKKEHGSALDEETVRGWLGHLVSQGLMFTEDSRYLSLAVRKLERVSRKMGLAGSNRVNHDDESQRQ